MIDLEIIPLPITGTLGTDNCYLLRSGTSSILIDGGVPSGGPQFVRKFKRLGIPCEEIKAVVLTHGHLDHIGAIADIQAFLKAPIYIHEHDALWVEKGNPPYPLGITLYGKIMVWAANRLAKMTVPGAQVSYRLDNHDLRLHNLGIPVTLVWTPGHTAGSISIITENGDVFVGDMAMNAWYLRLTPGLPILADDYQQVLRSWRSLIDRGVKTVYPAHGNPFPIQVIKQELPTS